MGQDDWGDWGLGPGMGDVAVDDGAGDDGAGDGNDEGGPDTDVLVDWGAPGATDKPSPPAPDFDIEESEEDEQRVIASAPDTSKLLVSGPEGRMTWIKTDPETARAQASLIEMRGLGIVGKRDSKEFIDIPGALRYGVDPKLLKALGVESEVIEEALGDIEQRKEYAGWTTEELIGGRITKEGVLIPVPWGHKAGAYVPPPTWVKEKIY
ncbi:hypothetical protein LCGC14_2153450, partial [marine sediment metagenome]